MPTDKGANELVANCIKQRANWSTLAAVHRFDNPTFDPARFREDMHVASPKLGALVAKIQELDAADLKKHGKLFKHFIYSDIKSAFGAKLIASALASAGFVHGYGLAAGGFKLAPLPPTTTNTFATLTSVSFFDRPIGVKFRRELLKRFNARPDNVHGENLRIMILDSGFREGVDLFDVKYAHLFEPIATANDEKQAIGRATRFCGQKGLHFHATEGWPVQVYRYETTLTRDMRSRILDADPTLLNPNQTTFFDLFLKFSNIDPRKITLARHLEATVIAAAVDAPLTHAVHAFGKDPKTPPTMVVGGASSPPPLPKDATHAAMDAHVRRHYADFAWPPVKVANGCEAMPTDLEFSPTQNFVRHYLTPASPYHGLLAFHSVGTGKTCTAIATATTSFEPAGWTILYVTKHTLKADVWKNMFDQSCSVVLQQRVKEGLVIPKEHAERMRLLSKSWRAIQPLSYRQFSNLLDGKSALADTLVKLNGKADPLKKTLIVIDEAHKLFAADVVGAEKGDVEAIRAAFQRSYATSGAAACKVLLMTGTPYTDDPMDMMRLLNLLRPASKALPDVFEAFAAMYLDDQGAFTDAARQRFMDAVAGNVSYLNREKDRRTFAYPVVHDVHVKMSEYAFLAELDDVMIVRNQIDKLSKKLDQLKEDATNAIDGVKHQSKALLAQKATQLAACRAAVVTDKACVRTTNAAKTEASRAARSHAQGERATCLEAGRRGEVAACKRAVKERLDRQLANIKAEHEVALAACHARHADAPDCDVAALRAELATLRASAKRDIAAALREQNERYGALIADTQRGLEANKRAEKPLAIALREAEKRDLSQQGALETCLAGRVPPAVRALKKGLLAKDMDLGSPPSDGDSDSSAYRPPVYLIAGHGNETYVAFDDRPRMPEGATLVVFSTCFKPNYADIACNFMDLFMNPSHTELLADPVRNQDAIAALLGSPIRVYAPGDRAPVLANTLFMNFSAHRTVVLKSGVFRVPDIPVVAGPHNVREERVLHHDPCMKFATVLKSPAHYGATAHRQIYEGNVYAKAAKQTNFHTMEHRLFPVGDVVRKLGPGVYYSLGCRSPAGAVKPAAAQLMDVFQRSEDQQQRRGQAAPLPPA